MSQPTLHIPDLRCPHCGNQKRLTITSKVRVDIEDGTPTVTQLPIANSDFVKCGECGNICTVEIFELAHKKNKDYWAGRKQHGLLHRSTL